MILFNCFIGALLPLFWKVFGDVFCSDVLPQRLHYTKTLALPRICWPNKDLQEFRANAK